MADKDEIPAFKITDKRVDDSWKEEVRREREAAARAAAAKPAPAPACVPKADAPKAEAQQEQGPAQPQEKAAKPGTAAEQQQSKIFLTFLAGLAQQALMQLGEMENPYTGQQEIDIQGARYTIELLATIQAKTKGNLTPDEEQSLGETIHDLKLRYVELANELQRQVQAQMQQGGPGAAGGRKPGPGGTISGPGFGRR